MSDGVRTALARVHREVARVLGQISMTLERASLSRRDALGYAATLRRSADDLERLVGARSGQKEE